MLSRPKTADNSKKPGKTDSNAALIESIYRIALEPQTYDDFMDLWGKQVAKNLADITALQDAEAYENPSDITRHFEMALQLLDQINANSSSNTEDPRPKDGTNPQFLIGAGGHIVWHSVLASTAFGINKNSNIKSLSLEENQADQLSKMTDKLGDNSMPTIVAPILLKMPAQGQKRPFHMYANLLPESGNKSVIHVTKASPEWPESMGAMLVEGFRLSASETAICALISEGQSAAHIAKFRESTIATVRTQIKRILSKTGCASQVELVCLLHSIMRIAEQSTIQKWQQVRPDQQSITMPVGDQNIPINVYGDPKGFPVIFFHGMLDSALMTRDFVRLLDENSLRMICPARPFFGAAEGVNIKPVNAPKAFSKSVMAMTDQMNIRDAVFLGHMAGTVYAFSAAAAAKSNSRLNIKGIVSVSGGVPIQSAHQFSSMSTRQQLVAYTARYAPKILPFVLRAGINQLNSGGEMRFLQSLYANSPDDIGLINDPALFKILSAGFHFAVDQGHKAFEIDSYHVVRDWSSIIDQTDIPIQVIHGKTDPVVSSESVESFYSKRANRARISILDKTGQLALYKEPGKVIDALCKFRDLNA